MHEDWSLSEEAVNGLTYLGTDHSSENDENDPDTCLLAPADDDPEGPYALYFSANPAIIFDRSRVAGVLVRSVPDAIDFLMARVTDAERSKGEPFDVTTRGTA
jgi:hypothetical protein